MKKQRTTSLIILLVLLNCSCNKIIDPPVHVGSHPYLIKFKDDKKYIEYVPVFLDSTRTRIIGYQTNQEFEDIKKQIIFDYKGYYLTSYYSLNTGFLSLTFEEFNSMIDTLNDSDIEELIMELHPFESVYSDPDGYLIPEIIKDTTYKYDTIKIKNLIDNNELDFYLTKLI